MSTEPRGGGRRARRSGRSRLATAVAVLVALGLGLGRLPPAVAKERDKVVVDKVDVRASPILGIARVRALISAIELAGGRIPHDFPPVLTVKVGGARTPFVTGLSRTAEVELAIVLVIATTDAYATVLDPIREELKTWLLAELEKLGPRVQMGVIGYDSVTYPQKRLGPVAAARSALDALVPEEVTSEVALARAIDDAIAMVARAKPKQAGALIRPIVIVVSDGDGIAVEDEARGDITELGQRADKLGVRIHSLGFSPTDQKRTLLTLGELSKRSNGTFRWITTMKGWDTALKQLVDQLTNQYVLTFLAPIDEVSGKRLAVTIQNAGQDVDAAPVPLKAPKCGKIACEGDAYCVRDKCVARRGGGGGGGGFLRWLLLIGGGVVGLGVVLVVGRAIVARRGPRPPPPMMPPPLLTGTMNVVAPAAPAPAPPPGGPVLIVMTGPEAGRQIPLHHGFTLGKAPGSHLGLGHDGFASTNHAQITFDGATWTLTDLGSTNGTFANGNRVTTVQLYPGMTVRVGSTDVRFWQG